MPSEQAPHELASQAHDRAVDEERERECEDAIALDIIGPFRGRCGICGHADARHRVLDAIRDRCAAGEAVKSLAHDYGLSESAIRRVLG